MYSSLEMLYATHVLEGKRDIETVPSTLRDNVQKIVEDAQSKQDAEQSAQ